MEKEKRKTTDYKGRSRKKKKKKTMNIILVCIAVFLLIFSTILLILYYRTGGIPDTLCTCIFGICGGECGIMGWIRTTKDKQLERQAEG